MKLKLARNRTYVYILHIAFEFGLRRKEGNGSKVENGYVLGPVEFVGEYLIAAWEGHDIKIEKLKVITIREDARFASITAVPRLGLPLS